MIQNPPVVARTKPKENTNSAPNLLDPSLSIEAVFRLLKSGTHGLSARETAARLNHFGENRPVAVRRAGSLILFLSKFANPLVIMLLGVAALSLFLGSRTDSLLIIAIALVSTILSFFQEYHAVKTEEHLRFLVKVTIDVWRDGKLTTVPLQRVVPGDVIELAPGKLVPADLRLISSKNLFVNQSALNGEAFPAAKGTDCAVHTPLSLYDWPCFCFSGSTVASGYGQGLVLRTGKQTELGQLAREIRPGHSQTAFDRGLTKYTWLMIRLTFILVLVVFVLNLFLKWNPYGSLLFALAIAIGMAPEMLPMIVAINLSRGALKMAKQKVVIKEMPAIQNFGAMDVLCTDKTGTLTMNEVKLIKHCDLAGQSNEPLLRLAFLNSYFQSGRENLLDRAIVNYRRFNLGRTRRIDEIPFDFQRKIISIVVKDEAQLTLIAKGAPEEIFKRSAYYALQGTVHDLTEQELARFEKIYHQLSRDGFRVLAVAEKIAVPKRVFDQSDEQRLTLRGFVAFLDPPKPTARQAIIDLKNKGIKLKVLSGDSDLVSRKICQAVGISVTGVLNGPDIDHLNDRSLQLAVEKATIFTRLTPFQKERIIKALQANNHTVGFLGDGINDAPALKAADVGISVDNAVDIAKDTAPIILLKKELTILGNCVIEGRRTFANVIKYLKVGSSSNFGDMLSMTGASILLPFLPMLPPQILLANLLYDISQIALPTDKVDPDYLRKPRRWNIDFIKKFMLITGPISSLFDFLTFGILWFIFHDSAAMFQTAWFVESLFTAVLVLHIIRTDKIPFFQSRASWPVLVTTFGIVGVGCLIPFTAFGQLLGFTPLSGIYFAVFALIAAGYLTLVQLVKRWFVRKYGYE